MAEKEEIEKILNEGLYKLLQSRSIVDFIQHFYEVGFTGNKLNQPFQDIYLLHNLLKQNLFLNLEMLFAPKGEDYSLTKLAANLNSIDKNDELVACRKKSIKLYNELEVSYIRKKYSAHLDLERESKNLEWKKIIHLIILGQELHDLIQIHIGNNPTVWSFNGTTLKRILTDRLQSIKLYETYREELSTDFNSKVTEVLKEIKNV